MEWFRPSITAWGCSSSGSCPCSLHAQKLLHSSRNECDRFSCPIYHIQRPYNSSRTCKWDNHIIFCYVLQASSLNAKMQSCSVFCLMEKDTALRHRRRTGVKIKFQKPVDASRLSSTNAFDNRQRTAQNHGCNARSRVEEHPRYTQNLAGTWGFILLT